MGGWDGGERERERLRDEGGVVVIAVVVVVLAAFHPGVRDGRIKHDLKRIRINDECSNMSAIERESELV